MIIAVNIPKPDLSHTSRARLVIAALILLAAAVAATTAFLVVDDALRYEAPINMLNRAASNIADDPKSDGHRLLLAHKIRAPRSLSPRAALNPCAPETLLAIRRDTERRQQPDLQDTLRKSDHGPALKIQEISSSGDPPYTLVILSMTDADADQIRRNHRHGPSNWFLLIAMAAAVMTAGGVSALAISRL